MAVFKTTRTIAVQNLNLEAAAAHISQTFKDRGFAVQCDPTAQGYLISLHQGGIFKSILGMKTAMNLKLVARPGQVMAEASVGVFGMQVIPTLISAFITWPVLLTQIWGLVKQSKLDDEVIAVAEEAVRLFEQPAMESGRAFCTKCGAPQREDAKFCPQCGNQIV